MADWVDLDSYARDNGQLDQAAPLDVSPSDTNAPSPDASPTWGDYGRAALSGVQQMGAGANAFGRYVHELWGDTTGAEIAKGREAENNAEAESSLGGMTPAGRQRLEASITSGQFWQHPFSSAALKGVQMTPALATAAIPGGVLAGALTAGMFGVQNAGDTLNNFYKQLDAVPDADLQRQSDVYRGLRTMYDEPEARRQFDIQMQGLKPALNAIVGAAAGAVGPIGTIARGGVAGAATRLGAAGLGAAEGAAGMGVQSAVADATQQYALKQAGQQQSFDPNQVAQSFVEGAATGALMGGVAGGVVGGHGRLPEHANQAEKGFTSGEQPKPAENVDVGNPDSAPTRSATSYPKGNDETPPGGTGPVETTQEIEPDQAIALAVNGATGGEAAPEPQGGEAQVADNPSAEPAADVAAQGAAMGGDKKAVWLSPQTVQHLQQVGRLDEARNMGIPLDNFDGQGGILIARDKATADLALNARQAGADMQGIIGHLTGDGEGKPAGTNTVVQQKDAQGNVTKESLVPPEEAAATQAQMAAEPGKTADVTTSQDALARRQQQVAQEQAMAAPGGQPVPLEGVAGRILTAQDDAAIRNQIAQGRQQDKNLNEALRPVEEAAPVSHKGADEIAAKQANAQKAQELFNASVPESRSVITDPAQRAAFLDGLRQVLAEAKNRGIEIPKRPGRTADAGHLMWLRDAQRMVERKTPPSYGDIMKFANRERDIRAGATEAVRAERAAEGDEFAKATVAQPETEEAIANTPATTESPEAAVIRQEEEGEGGNFASEKEAYTAGRERQVTPQGKGFVAGKDNTGKFKVETKKRRVIPQEGSVPKNAAYKFETSSRANVDTAEGIEKTTVRDIFRRLDQQGVKTGQGIDRLIHPFVRKKLLDTVGDMPVHIVDNAEMSRIEGDNVGAYYDPVQHQIVMARSELRNGENLQHVLTHESIHAISTWALHTDPRMKALLSQVIEHVKGVRPDLARHYGLSEPGEFLAEGLSNPAFQQELANIAVPDHLALQFDPRPGAIQSAWDMLVATVRRALGMPKKMTSALEVAMHSTRDLEAKNASVMQFHRDIGSIPEAARLTITPKIQAAVHGAIEQPADTAINAIHAVFDHPDVTAGLRTLGRKLMTNMQFGRRIEGELPHGKQIFDTIEKQGVLSQKLKQQGTDLVGDLMRLKESSPPKTFDRFAKLINDQTMVGVDASSPLFQGRNDYLTLSKENQAKLANGTFKTHMANMNHWEALDAHPELRKEYNALTKEDPRFKEMQERVFKFFTDAQQEMATGHVDNFLKAAGVDAATRATLARDLATKKLSPELKEQLTKQYGDVIAKGIIDANKISGTNGVYAPLMRHGDYVVGGKYKVEEPKASPTFVRKADDGSYEFKTRQAANEFAKKSGLKYDVESRWYDPVTGERTTSADETATHSPEQRFAVDLQRQHTSFHDTRKEALGAADDLRKSGILEGDPYVEQHKAYLNRTNEITAGALSTMLKKLEQTDEYRASSPAQKSSMRQALEESALVTRAGNRVQSRRLPRRRVGGASEDLVRNLWIYNESQAAYRAKIKYRPEIDDTLRNMWKYVEDNRYKGDTLRRSEWANEIENRAMAQDPSDYTGAYSVWTRRLNTYSYIDRMMRPSHLILHQTHLPMITTPVLAARHGLRAYGTVLRAWKQAMRAYPAGGKDVISSIADRLHKGTNFDDLMTQAYANGPDAQRIASMIKTLGETGVIHPQAGLEIAKYIPHRQLGGPVGFLDRSLARFDTIFRHATNATEAINRYVGAVSAYRLEFDKAMREGIGENAAHDRATQYARNTLEDTQGLYSSTNAAPLFKNKALRPFLQFRQFPQMMYNLLIKSAAQAYKGVTWEEKMQGAAQLAAVLGTHTLMTGLLGGLPLEAFKVAGMVSKGLGITNNDWSDFERWQYKEAVAQFGKEGADLLMHGISRQLTGVDVHHRLGLNSFFTFGMPDKLDKDHIWSFLAQAATGAPGGLVGDALQGTSQMMHGDMAGGFLKATPLQALRDVNRAWEGGSKNYKYDITDTAKRLLGFTPAKEAEFYERQSNTYAQKQEYSDQRNSWIKQYKDAQPGDRAVLWSQIQRWNAQQAPASRLTMSQLLQSSNRKPNASWGVSLNKQTQFIKDRNAALYGQ